MRPVRRVGQDRVKVNAWSWAYSLEHTGLIRVSVPIEPRMEIVMGKGLLLWLVGVPIPVILLLWLVFHH